jgi:hypothetical protein
MDLAFDILLGAGIAAAVGIRPFLPVLLVGALATANIGLKVSGTDFAFLKSWPFLLVVLAGVGVLDLVARRKGKLAFESGYLMYILLTVSLALGALEASGALAHGRSTTTALAIGIPVGILCAAIGFAAMRVIFVRVLRRLDDKAAGALPVYAEGSGMLVAGTTILFPPLAVVSIVFLLWLLYASRRREKQKYAGLRILR